MVYKWKIPGIIPVEANTAGEEIERIHSKYGEVTPANVVAENSPPDTPLHCCFEWNDAIAANRYREIQAEKIIGMITVVAPVQDESGKDVEVRAFVHTDSAYHPISIVLNSGKMRTEMLDDALKELKAFKRKYETLSELVPVFEALTSIEKPKTINT